MASTIPGVDRNMGRRVKVEKESSPAWLECKTNKGKRKPVLPRVLWIT